MTTSTRRAHAPAWVLAFLAAVLAVVLGAFTAGPASALTASAAQNAVGASTPTAQVAVEPSASITAGPRLGNDPPQPRTVVATGVAANTGRTAARTCLRSFAGTTLVLMADGTKKPIKDIKVGDEVVATDPETGERVTRKVTYLWVHDDELADLVLADGSVLTTTTDHLFWSVTDQRFEQADQLTAGEVVLGDSGRQITVIGFRPGTESSGLAYNLEIAGVHTYHVGPEAILVHNECSDEAWDIAMKAFDKHGADMGFKSVDEMGAYVDDVMSRSAGHLRDDGSRFWIDYGNSAIIFRGPNAGVPGSVYRPDNFSHAVDEALRRAVNE